MRPLLHSRVVIPLVAVLTVALYSVTGIAQQLKRAERTGISSETTPPPQKAQPKPAPCKLVRGTRHAVIALTPNANLQLDDGSEVVLDGVLLARPPLHAANARRPSATWPAAIAARKALATATLGKSVELFYASRYRKTRYGAMRAQIFVLEGEEKIWLQRTLVRAGHARVSPARLPPTCVKPLLTAEAQARAAQAGIWQHAPYSVRPAWKTRELLRYQRTFQIVEGRIRSIGDRRGRIYLNFGKRWSDDFTATISKRARKRMEKNGFSLDRLRGATVRVRGWVEEWNGPAIRIENAAQLEIVRPGKKRRRRIVRAQPEFKRTRKRTPEPPRPDTAIPHHSPAPGRPAQRQALDI